jgi:hypothetical protein
VGCVIERVWRRRWGVPYMIALTRRRGAAALFHDVVV